jgi:hypothetical protein
MPLTVEVLSKRDLKITGQTSLRMSDFNVRPPQALAGLIKAGNTVEVGVQWFVKSPASGLPEK